MSSNFTFYNSPITSDPSCNSKYDSASCLLQCDDDEIAEAGHCGGGQRYPQSNQPLATISNQIQLRFLNPNDYDTVKGLCEDWFPVEYPATWFEAITSDSSFFSLAAILNGEIIGEGR